MRKSRLFSKIFRQFFWRDPYHHEVDIIKITNEEQIVPIEVKYQDKIYPDELKNIVLFAKKFKCDQAVILHKGVTEEQLESGLSSISIVKKPIFII